MCSRYSPEQLYNVVANVDQYQHFVPWCKKSRFIQRKKGDLKAELVIGFPPVMERYTSDLTFVPNHKVRVSFSCLLAFGSHLVVVGLKQKADFSFTTGLVH